MVLRLTIVSIPYGKGKVKKDGKYIFKEMSLYQFPMGKVKQMYDVLFDFIMNVSIPYGKGKAGRRADGSLPQIVSIPYGKGKAFASDYLKKGTRLLYQFPMGKVKRCASD